MSEFFILYETAKGDFIKILMQFRDRGDDRNRREISGSTCQPRAETLTDFFKEAHILLVVRSPSFRTVGKTRSHKRIEELNVQCRVLNDECA